MSNINCIIKFATEFLKDGGQLNELWVSRVVYDRLSLELMKKCRFVDNEDSTYWENGIIKIWIQGQEKYLIVRRTE